MRVAFDVGHGVPVVLLHGQPGTADLWHKALPALAALPVRLIGVDRPGYHGEPGRARGFAGNARRLRVLLDDLHLPSAILVAHSWAGAVALEAGLRMPDRVRGVLLLASVGTNAAVSRSDRLLAQPVGGRLIVSAMAGARERLDLLLGWSSGSRLPPEDRVLTRAELARWRQLRAWEAFRVEQLALVHETARLEARLPQLGVAATVVQGRRDGYVPVAAGRALAAALPGAVYVEVDAGHVLPVEQVPLIAALLADLLARTDRGGAPRPG